MIEPVRKFADRLTPLNRILDLSGDDWAVWCCAPIYGPDGKVHVFFSRAPGTISTWTMRGEIAHATADHPAGPYTVHGTVIRGRGPGHWDSHGLINARIYRVDDTYALFYNAVGDATLPETQWRHGIGLCVSRDLWNWSYANGGQPLLSRSENPAGWDRFRCDNPAFLRHPATGACWLYYTGSYPRAMGMHDSIGLAHAPSLEGPYQRMFDHPVIDTSRMTGRSHQPFRGVEDAHVWVEGGTFHMLVHDLGYDVDEAGRFEDGGLYFESADGIHWSDPVLGYHGAAYYWNEHGRLETPFLLHDRSGKPEYLFVNRDTGGRATGFVFRIG